MNYDASGVTGASSAELYHKAGIQASSGTHAAKFSVLDGMPAKQDLVVIVFDNAFPPNPIAAKMLTQNVTDGSTYNITLTDAYRISMSGTFPDFSGGVPNGRGVLRWEVDGVTANGTPLPELGIGFSATGGKYYKLPSIVAMLCLHRGHWYEHPRRDAPVRCQ